MQGAFSLRINAPAVIQLLRVEQWIKNLFILIPAFFGGVFFEIHNILHLLLGFLAYSFVASSIYIINDHQDVESDRAHPEKRYRPLAAGTVSTLLALIICSLLLIMGFSISFKLSLDFGLILLIYFLVNLGYSLGLKHIGILDMLIVASGFLLRTLAGGVIVDVAVSQWLIIMIFLLALFMAIAKRRADVVLSVNSGNLVRQSVSGYNLDFINMTLTMVSGIILVSYIMYTLSDEITLRLGQQLYLTSVFVIAGIMRYLQITLVLNNSSSPTNVLYKDTFIKVSLIGWIVCFLILIYFM